MTPQQSERNYRTDDLVVGKIIELTINGEIPAEIYRRLQQDPLLSQFSFSKKTVERIASDHKPPPGETDEAPQYWNLLQGDGEDARYVLEARYGRILRYGRDFPRPRKWEAEAVVKLLRAVPDFPRDIAWFFARIYGTLVLIGVNTTAFDDYLAFTPWRTAAHYNIYLSVIQMGWVRAPLLWEVLVEQQNPALTFEEKIERIARWNQQEKMEWQA